VNHNTAVGGLHFNASPRPKATQHELTLLFRGTNTRNKKEIDSGAPGLFQFLPVPLVFDVALTPEIGA